MADSIYTWIRTHIKDASRAPQISRDGRVFSPVQGFDQGGMVVLIYRDVAAPVYYAEIAGMSLGYIEHADWENVLREVSARYAATLLPDNDVFHMSSSM